MSLSIDGKYVFVLAETRQGERTDGGKKEKGEQRGVCLYSEPKPPLPWQKGSVKEKRKREKKEKEYGE